MSLAVRLFSVLAAGVISLLAADKPGSQDHPMVSRYEGAEIVAYKTTDFDEYNLLVKKASSSGGIQKNLASTKPLQGKITKISYRAPTGRSTLEVFRNYEAALKGAGFEPVFACRNADCGGRGFNHAVAPYMPFGELYQDQRYLASRLERAEGEVYAVLYVALGSVSGGPKNTPYVQLDIIEAQPMQSEMVTVDAIAMEKGIAADGHIALYNIYFETNQATLQPSSKPALEEIAKLMSASPQLRLLVTGHTDNVGEVKYNLDLSSKRAASVVQALTSEHSVAASRLTAAGVGMYAPVASNKSEAGRAKNRRVELVER